MNLRMKAITSLMLLGLPLAVNSAIADEKHDTSHMPATDERTALTLAPGERAAVLKEMRQFLSGVQLMTDAMARDDAKAMAQAARSMGRAAAHEVPPALRAKLPVEFRQLGFSVHDDFDQMAMDAESMGDMKHSMTQLAGTLQKCVACHSIYQIQGEAHPRLVK